ncbi:glyoxylate reductase/hydroxypyruvate reductase [Agrilus planipennis]|uniref:Glyoxylate reductase/hydroxypyruvate reductase n=1 Tax=Agrilus planipennis TaxID=224129 RepID=A0A1W4W4J5_AGRPL|nr:glyoxylate reductase/hydroxypyruvate reductase [Agrilus planipennis]
MLPAIMIENIIFVTLIVVVCGGVAPDLGKAGKMSLPKVLVTNNDIPEAGLDLLKGKFELIINNQSNPTRQEIIDKIAGVDALFWCTHQRLDEEILDAAGSQLKVVATMSAGLNHIDIDALKRRNIPLAHTPTVLNKAVANVAVLLALAASRRLRESRIHIEEGLWSGFGVQYLLGTDIENSTVGIVGLGGIGQTIAKRLKAFEVARILYSGHRENPEGKQLGAEFVPLDTLLRESDFVIVSAPLTDETKNMFNDTTFAKMKPTAVFVNIARGPIVDQDALIRALKNGTIFAAGLDVMVPEPLPTNNELLKLPNCVLMPHLGSATYKTRTAMAELTAKNIILGYENKPLLTPAY